MDGLTCVRTIRKMQNEGLIIGHVPIIAVTANARGEQIAAAKDSGMVSCRPCQEKRHCVLILSQDDVMPKPFRIRQLIPKIEALLSKTAAREAGS